MHPVITFYVHWVDRINRVIGRATMYLVYVMLAVLFYSAITKAFFTPALWTLEFAQFLMVAYFLVGGAYSIQLEGHVRMDLLYGTRSLRTRLLWDCVTVLFLLTYLGFLLYGGLSSTSYSLQYMERSYSAWQPYMWPIKVVMCFGISLMILQMISQFFKDLAAYRGVAIS